MKSAMIMNSKAIVSSKGQVVIPRQLREALGIHSGSELIFEMHDGILELKPIKHSIEKFFGSCKRKGEKKADLRSIDESIMQAVIDNEKY